MDVDASACKADVGRTARGVGDNCAGGHAANADADQPLGAIGIDKRDGEARADCGGLILQRRHSGGAATIGASATGMKLSVARRCCSAPVGVGDGVGEADVSGEMGRAGRSRTRHRSAATAFRPGCRKRMRTLEPAVWLSLASRLPEMRVSSGRDERIIGGDGRWPDLHARRLLAKQGIAGGVEAPPALEETRILVR